MFLGLIIVHRENHPLVTVIAEKIVIAWVVGISSFDDILDECDRRIVTPAVMFASGFDNDFIQLDTCWSKLDFKVIGPSCSNGNSFGGIA